MKKSAKIKSGFTLIELSIVLVIIGLIIGGVLVGRDLIDAAAIRAQISQLEKYNTAVNTFRVKYGYLPGDIPNPTASQFGFAAGQYAGEGDGNGYLEGVFGNAPAANYGLVETAGETVMFWVDLSMAGLIEGGFNTANPTTPPGSDITGASINLYLPQAKIGRGNYVYVYSSIYIPTGNTDLGINYFGLSAATNLAASTGFSLLQSNPNLSVAEAYNIDRKIDDGLPQSGRVMAWYLNSWQYWTDGTEASMTPNEPAPYPGPLSGTATTCYDNGGGSGPQQFSMGQNGGAGLNCALSFRFQ